jgi:hypothetical protein
MNKRSELKGEKFNARFVHTGGAKSSKSEPFYDSEELRKKILDVMMEMGELDMEQKKIDQQIQELEESNAAAAQENNIGYAHRETAGWEKELDEEMLRKNNAIHELRNSVEGFGVGDKENVESTNIRDVPLIGQGIKPVIRSEDEYTSMDNIIHHIQAGAKGLSEQDKRYYEQDLILEFKILNAEMRSALPKLEAECLNLETGIYGVEKEAKRAIEKNKQLPDLLTKTSEELQEIMGGLLEDQVRMNQQMEQENEEAKLQKSDLLQEISSLREQMAFHLDESNALSSSIMQLRSHVAHEDGRKNALRKELLKVRSMFDKHYGPHGWTVQAFRHATGNNSTQYLSTEDSDKERLPKGSIVSTLEDWLMHMDAMQNEENQIYLAKTVNDLCAEMGIFESVDVMQFKALALSVEEFLDDKISFSKSILETTRPKVTDFPQFSSPSTEVQ